MVQAMYCEVTRAEFVGQDKPVSGRDRRGSSQCVGQLQEGGGAQRACGWHRVGGVGEPVRAGGWTCAAGGPAGGGHEAGGKVLR